MNKRENELYKKNNVNVIELLLKNNISPYYIPALVYSWNRAIEKTKDKEFSYRLVLSLAKRSKDKINTSFVYESYVEYLYAGESGVLRLVEELENTKKKTDYYKMKMELIRFKFKSNVYRPDDIIRLANMAIEFYFKDEKDTLEKMMYLLDADMGQYEAYVFKTSLFEYENVLSSYIIINTEKLLKMLITEWYDYFTKKLENDENAKIRKSKNDK